MKFLRRDRLRLLCALTVLGAACFAQTPVAGAEYCGTYNTGWKTDPYGPFDNPCPRGCLPAPRKPGISLDIEQDTVDWFKTRYRARLACVGKRIRPNANIGRTDEGVPDRGTMVDFSGTAVGALSTCPKGSFVTQIQGFKSDRLGSHVPSHPIAQLRFSCKTVKGKTVFIGRTSRAVPKTGRWSGFSGTYQGGPGACPSGSFVRSIQAFKAKQYARHNNERPIAAIRFECARPDGRLVKIGISEPGMPRRGGWGGFSGTLAGGLGRCPAGSFVYAIQAFKADTAKGFAIGSGDPRAHDPIAALRFPCRKPGS